MGEQDMFVFSCILLYKFNAYRNINEVVDVDYGNHSFCLQLADDMSHIYANEPK